MQPTWHRAALLFALVSLGAVLGCSEHGTETEIERIRIFSERGDLTEAQRLARAHLLRVERTQSTDPLALAAALDLLVETLWEGEPDELREGLDAARRSLEIKRRQLPQDPAGRATSLFHIGVILTGLGDHREGRRLLEDAAVACRSAAAASEPVLADVLVALANAEIQLADYRSASVHFEEALRLLRATRDDHDLDLAFARAMYGNLLAQTGDYDAAIALHEQALAARVRHYGRLHPRVAGSLNNLGAIQLAAGHPELALKSMREALDIREEILGPGHSLVASTRSNVSAILDDLGEHAAADELLAQSVAELIGALGPDHPDVAELIAAQAARAGRSGDRSRAVALYSQALGIRERAFGPAHGEVAATLVDLAPLVAAQGETDRALEMSLRAEEIGRELHALTSQVLSERQALRFSEIRASGLDLAIALASSGAGDTAIARVWTALIRARASVLDEMVARRRLAARSADPQVAQAWAGLSAARENLATITIEGLRADAPEEYRRRLEEAREERERAERRLAGGSAEFREAHARARWGFSDVSRRLPAGSALLAYALHEDPLAGPRTPRYAAFLLPRPGASPLVVPIGPADEIDALVGNYREAISDLRRPDMARDAGNALRRRIWDPIEALLAEDTRLLLVVPDGELHLVNLATLPVGESDYLIESGPMIHSLASERDTIIDPETRTGDGLLALGNPAVGPATSLAVATPGAALRDSVVACFSLDRTGFVALPGATREIAEIVEMWVATDWGAALDLVGTAASESAFKEYAPGKRVVHLATHGFHLDSECVGRRLALRGITGLAPFGGANGSPRSEQPSSVFSGVVLAAPRAADREDGILTAEEIAALDLSGVEWAVLSACETGVGQVQAGEGLLGLRRAFHVAGAATLITSLWPVEDEATLEWMRLLYGGRLDGMTTAEAVHHATLSALRARRRTGRSTHPFFWGGFVATGDWR